LKSSRRGLWNWSAKTKHESWPDKRDGRSHSLGARAFSRSGESRPLRFASQRELQRGSDIDLTLFGSGLKALVLSQINSGLDDLLLPHKIDISIFAKISHPDLIDHIRRVGVVFHEKQSAAAHI
jgi:hypothetical protein